MIPNTVDPLVHSHATILANDTFAEMKAWLADNQHDIKLIIEEAKAQLQKRNELLAATPNSTKQALSAEHIEYGLAILRDLLVQELEALQPSQKLLNQARQEAFDFFPLRRETRINLDHFSIDSVIFHVFQERTKVLEGILRGQVKERQKHNDLLENIGLLKTLLAGHQPSQGETVKTVTIAQLHEDIMKIKLIANRAGFNIQDYQNLTNSTNEIVLSYAHYQQLNMALAAHTDKHTNLMTAQQLSMTDLKRQIDQAWELLSTFMKRLHDLLQTILHNLR